MRYEYKTVFITSGYGIEERQLNALGAEGWELVNVVEVKSGLNYIFKRQAQRQPFLEG